MDEQNELDESDRRLAEALKQGIANGKYEVSIQTERTDDSEATSSGTVAAYGSRSVAAEGVQGSKGSEAEDEMDTPFMQALNAYRAAKKGGDTEAIRAAERHLQEVTRAELQANEGCEPVK